MCQVKPASSHQPAPPTAKEREIVEKAAGFGLPHDKICQLIVSERMGKPIGLYNIPLLRNPFLRCVNAEFVVIGDL